MKAVILAAGKGTRMRELTNELPKPMLPIRGKPVLQIILEDLIAAGIDEVLMITGFRAEVIESHFGDGTKFGARIEYVRQVVQDGTGKAPELAQEFVGQEPFLLTYGDILVSASTYRRMLSRFSEGGYSGLVTVTKGEEVAKGGLLLFDQDACLTSLVEKPTADQVAELRQAGHLRPDEPLWYNAGIYIFTPGIFDYTARLEKSARGEYELTDAILRMVHEQHRLVGLEIHDKWVDVRDPEILADLNRSGDSSESGSEGR